MLVLTLAMLCLYMWLVVYSTYRFLEIKKGIIHEVHTVSVKRYMRAPTMETMRKPQRQHIALPQPYEV